VQRTPLFVSTLFVVGIFTGDYAMLKQLRKSLKGIVKVVKSLLKRQKQTNKALREKMKHERRSRRHRD
jgi:hypothetical protein